MVVHNVINTQIEVNARLQNQCAYNPKIGY